MTSMNFVHQKFEAYRLSIELVASTQSLVAQTLARNRTVGDQFQRALISIPLNIAEGCGRPTGPDRRRFYLIARGSANECAAILDVMLALGLLDQSQASKHLATLNSICAILTSVCFNQKPTRPSQ